MGYILVALSLVLAALADAFLPAWLQLLGAFALLGFFCLDGWWRSLASR